MKPVKLAVALKHEFGKQEAPRVVASGRGAFAERIIEKAIENQIPVHEDDHLASLLSKVSVPSTIPEELFEAVARVLAFIYRVDKRGMG
ncbi:MAG: EscU/YscU/HrcU family type III secretion system export apparatus switch protein [Fibromonadaceae bacterium]|jgi:flagellar biosynthesis protein|nr:EscU/YscU/HrcU family type III secretion system export apparatus switch protein [Fibromonadaceae bacterium]